MQHRVFSPARKIRFAHRDPERSARWSGAIRGASEESFLSLICVKWLPLAVLRLAR
jgi:hypothetical protein